MTPREFFQFHLNIRRTGSDYLFQGNILFQEYNLHAWIVCENQRLAFQRQNQTTLREDTYRNIQESVANRRQEVSLYHDEIENAVGHVFFGKFFPG